MTEIPCMRALAGKRILIVTTVDLTAYAFVRPWIRRLRTLGADVTVACTVTRFQADLEAAGAAVAPFAISRRLSPFGDAAAVGALTGFMRHRPFDLVHTQTAKAGFLGRLAAKRAGIPAVVHTMHEPPHVSVRFGPLRALYISLERLASRWADRVITVSQACKAEILAHDLVPADRLVVIPNGLDPAAYAPPPDPDAFRDRMGIPRDAPLLGTVGRLEAAKGHRDLLDALPRIWLTVPNAWCVITGEGRLRASLEAQARRLPRARQVVFAGFQEDLSPVLSSLDCFVLPSRWEGFGVVLLEAMAFRLPIVATRVGGVGEVVVDGVTGYLVPPLEPDLLGSAVAEVFANPAAAQTLGTRGRRRLETEFSLERHLAAHQSLYETLLAPLSRE